MNIQKCDDFVEQIMHISTTVMKNGGVRSSILGSGSTADELARTLRRHAAIFAIAYEEERASEAELAQLKNQLEGSIRALAVVGKISDKDLNNLITDLDAL
jgi:hypothetical protein